MLRRPAQPGLEVAANLVISALYGDLVRLLALVLNAFKTPGFPCSAYGNGWPWVSHKCGDDKVG